MKRRLHSFAFAGLVWLAVCIPAAAESLIISSLTPTGSQLTITVQTTGSITNQQLQSSAAPNGIWAPVAATFAPVSGQPGFARTTITRPTAASTFYRVVGTTIVIITDPLNRDTDGDGFSDGVEFIYGTDLTDPTKKPVFDTTKPTVNFVLADSTAAEGTSPHQVQIAFDRSYSGTLNYAINTLSSTVAGTDYSLGGAPTATTGSLTVSGTSAFIPITLLDDTNSSGQRSIILDLKLGGENYFIGGRSSHVVILNDNDAWWTGTLVPASGDVGNRIFRLKIAHQGGAVSAAFGAGAGQDGLRVPVVTAGNGAPDIATTSISTSIIPVGSWPVTSIAESATSFHAESPILTIPAVAGSLLNQPLRRQLVLNTQISLDTAVRPHSILPGIRYVGDYTETLTSPTGALLATLSGSFILMRDLPSPLPRTSNLAP